MFAVGLIEAPDLLDMIPTLQSVQIDLMPLYTDAQTSPAPAAATRGTRQMSTKMFFFARIQARNV